MIKFLISFLMASILLSQKVAVELDHFTIITSDLEKSIKSWEEKGFTVKRRIAHENTIHNAIIEFEAQNEIELLTAKEAKDDLSAWYLKEISKSQNQEKLVKVAFRVHSEKDFKTLEKNLKKSKRSINKIDFGYALTLAFNEKNPLFPFYFIYYKKAQLNKAPWTIHKNATKGIKSLIISESQLKLLDKLVQLPALIITKPNINTIHYSTQ